MLFNELERDRPEINGFSYLTESDYPDINTFEKIIGLIVYYSTTGFKIDLPKEINFKDQNGEAKLIEIKPKNLNPQSRNVSYPESLCFRCRANKITSDAQARVLQPIPATG